MKNESFNCTFQKILNKSWSTTKDTSLKPVKVDWIKKKLIDTQNLEHCYSLSGLSFFSHTQKKDEKLLQVTNF